MGRTLSEDLRSRVVGAVEGGLSRRAAAKRFGVGVATAIRWVRVFHATGVTKARRKGGDQRSQRIEAYRAVILGAVEAEVDITLVELADGAAFYIRPRPLPLDGKAAKVLEGAVLQGIGAVAERLARIEPWTEEAIEAACRETAEAADVPFGKLAQGLRAALTGTTVSPGLFEVLQVLGPTEAAARIGDAAADRNPAATV